MGEDRSARHDLFAAALDRTGWNVRQLWLAYVALGGLHDAFDLDAYLQGLTSWAANEQDTLAVALNERQHDLHLDTLVPYLLLQEPSISELSPHLDPIITELLGPQRNQQDK